MKNFRWSLLFMPLLLTMLYLAPWPSTIVKAEENKTVDFNEEVLSKNYYLDQDMTLRGVFGSNRFYLSIDKHWGLKSAQFNFSLIQSELLDQKLSTITFYINDKPVHSMMLADIRDESKIINFNVPTEALKQGINELRVEVFRRISDNQCADDINKGNWVTVKGSSYIHLEFNEQKPTDSIAEYPYPFLKASDNFGTSNTTIMIPGNPDEEEAAAAVQVAANLGAMAKDKDIRIGISAYSGAGEDIRKSNNIIFIGKLKDIPREILDTLPGEASAKAKEGAVIFRTSSPYNNVNKLMCLLTDGNEGMLDKAAKFLFNGDLVGQIDSNICFLGKDQQVDIRPQKETDDNFSLKDLGYGDGIYLKGPLHQETTIGIKLPVNRQYLPGSKIKLNIRYSQNLDFSKALVTVYINGIPVGSKKLEASAANNDFLEVNIPGDAIKGSYVELRIAFDLEMVNYKCNLKTEEMPWAFVTSTSDIYLPTKDENSFLFENYPWPFVKDGKLNKVTVVVPDDIASADLNLLSNIFAYMGRSINDNTGNLRVVRDSSFSGKYGDSNIIFIGTPAELKSLKSINSSMYFKYDDSFSYFLSNEMRNLMEDFSRTLSSMQLITSPYNKSCGILVVTAPRKENVVNTEKYLTQSKYAGSLIGNAALVDQWGDITNHYFILKTDSKASLLQKIENGGQNLEVFVVSFITIIILLIISIGLYFRKYKRR